MEGTATLSSRYELLVKRLDELEDHYVMELLEKPIFDLTPKELDMCRGYRLLCHAEIEDYLEERAKELLDLAKDNWFTHQKINTSLLSLFAHYKFISNPEIQSQDEIGKKNTPKYMNLNDKVGKICADFKEDKIKGNHGVKQKNLISLLIPLGIDIFSLDAAWLSTMDTFGSRRGETAHTSSKTQQPIDLPSEKGDLKIILSGLKELDLKFNLIIQTT